MLHNTGSPSYILELQLTTHHVNASELFVSLLTPNEFAMRVIHFTMGSTL